ncbi:MAG: efflux RND transporter periplasmic adaptor subunit [Bacteroidaceae bacterium]|nr:efflux RND transporter periplasmic adaptor subunit [Bacteroidaceae bacterium]
MKQRKPHSMMRTAWMGLCASLIVCSCGQGNSHKEEEHEHEAHEGESGVIIFGADKAKAAGLTIEEVKPGSFQSAIRVSGQVMEAQGDEAAVIAKSSGVLRYVREHLSEGMTIRQGEVLAVISSEGIAGGDPVAQNHADLKAKQAALERAKRLMEDTLISRKEYERIEAEYEMARLTAGSGKNKSGASATSPLTGYVKQVLVNEGGYVEVGQTIAMVTKNCNLQLRAELPEKFFAEMPSIVDANFIMSYDEQTVHRVSQLNGHLVSMGRSASEGSAYIPITFEFDNRGSVIPGSFADIWLLGNVREKVLSVPIRAITEEQGIHYVYRQLPSDEPGEAPHEYEKCEVRLGHSNGQRTEILSGIQSGDRIVVEGVIQVKLAGASGAIPEAHSHSH